jgi:hypothetical protein
MFERDAVRWEGKGCGDTEMKKVAPSSFCENGCERSRELGKVIA